MLYIIRGKCNGGAGVRKTGMPGHDQFETLSVVVATVTYGEQSPGFVVQPHQRPRGMGVQSASSTIIV